MRNARGLSEGKKESPHTEENRKRGYESKFTGEMVARSPTKRKEIMILLFYSFLTVYVCLAVSAHKRAGKNKIVNS